MLQALRGAEDAALKAGGCHRHGHVGVERSYCPQPLAAVAHALEALPELRPRYAIVGLFEVNKTGAQLAANALPPPPRVPPLWLLTPGAAAAALPLLPVALDDRAQGQGSLLGAALPAEAELALCVQACRLCVSRHAALKPSCEQLGQQGADRYAPQVARLSGAARLRHQRDGAVGVAAQQASDALPSVELRSCQRGELRARLLQQPGREGAEDCLALRRPPRQAGDLLCCEGCLHGVAQSGQLCQRGGRGLGG